MVTKVFDTYSMYYNLLYKDKDYEAESDYIAELLGEDVKSVFEMGCGTGRHAKLLSSKGYKMFGIDLSKTMLKQAKDLGIECEQGDVRNFRAGKKFDAVISLFHVASYQTTDSDIENYFKTAAAHLNHGGKFIFDIWFKPAVLAQVPEKRVKTLENDEVKVVRYCEPNHIKEKDIVEVNYTIEVTDKHSGKTETIKECHPMRYFSSEDIENFASQCGFKIVKSEEWLTHKTPGPDTWGVCYVAKLR